jgi:hypothetical protein
MTLGRLPASVVCNDAARVGRTLPVPQGIWNDLSYPSHLGTTDGRAGLAIQPVNTTSLMPTAGRATLGEWLVVAEPN